MKKSFPPFYMNVKHVLFTTSATRFDQLIWIVIGVLLMKVGNGTPTNKA